MLPLPSELAPRRDLLSCSCCRHSAVNEASSRDPTELRFQARHAQTTAGSSRRQSALFTRQQSARARVRHHEVFAESACDHRIRPVASRISSHPYPFPVLCRYHLRPVAAPFSSRLTPSFHTACTAGPRRCRVCQSMRSSRRPGTSQPTSSCKALHP